MILLIAFNSSKRLTGNHNNVLGVKTKQNGNSTNSLFEIFHDTDS
jgi:hypothetical protein